MRLEGKVALITGAAQGFGAEIARVFAREGAKIAAVDLNLEGARALAGELPAAIAVQGNVASMGDAARAVAETLSAFGRLDILVNNAGTTYRNRPMLDVSEEEFDRVFAVNVKSIFTFAHAAVPPLQKNGGAIVNIGSTAGIRPRPGLTWYNGTKGAVHLMTKSMALELAPHKIRVNALAPAAGETPLLSSFIGEETPERRAQFVSTIPLGRFSMPRDIANAALFLASDEAEFITGAVLEVDGGRCV